MYPSDVPGKPTGYYEEIAYPYKKKAIITKCFKKKYKIKIHTNKNKNYKYLEDNGLSISIKDKITKQDLYIDIEGRFTLGFSDWHTHYEAYEYDFSQMVKAVNGILKNKKCVVSIYDQNHKLCCSMLRKSKEVKGKSHKKLIKMLLKEYEDEEYYKDLSAKLTIGSIEIHYWNPKLDKAYK